MVGFIVRKPRNAFCNHKADTLLPKMAIPNTDISILVHFLAVQNQIKPMKRDIT